MEKRCFGCMQLKHQSPLCEHCGYNENIDNLPHQLPVGTILGGQYQVGKVLGQGGFGITYIGWDTALDNPVAIKEYYPGSVVNRSCLRSLDVELTGPNVSAFFHQNRERFLQEARILAKLRDISGIVRVQNLFEENNTAYIVMEYVQGIDLHKYIRLQGGRLSVQETLTILRPLMHALQKVHEAELIHRDISPDNIMVLRDGSVKLLDFGAARVLTDEESEGEIARSTEAILKVGFAPIEQYQKRGSLGPWTDVYALCATIYYCLTGKVPPEAPERMAEDAELDWSAIPGLTGEQIAALEQGMALRARERTSSVRELQQGLYGPEAAPERKPATIPATAKPAKTRKPQELPPTLDPDQPEPQPGKKTPRPPSGEKPEHKKKKSPVLPVVAVLLALIFGGVLLVLRHLPGEPAHTDASWKNNVLMADAFLTRASEFDEEYLVSQNTDFASACEGVGVLGSGVPRGSIRTVTVLDTLADAPEDACDVSAARDGAVLAWVTEGENLFIGAEGGVNARQAAPYLFCFYSNATDMELDNLHTEEVRDFSCMFTECAALKQLDLSDWNTSSAATMAAMFRACGNLEQLDISGFDTSGVTDMQYLFYGCTALEELKTGTFDVSSVQSYDHFMEDGAAFSGQPWQNLFHGTDSASTAGGKILMQDPIDRSMMDFTDILEYFQYVENYPVLGSDIPRNSICSVTFLDSLAQMPASAWDVSEGCTGSVMAWVVENGTDYNLFIAAEGGVTAGRSCAGLFQYYTGVKTIHFDGCFRTEAVTDMSDLFRSCYNLESVDLTGVDTSSVTDMSGMFLECWALEEVNLTGLDFSVVTEYAFFMDDGKTVAGKPWETLFEQASARTDTWQNNLLKAEALSEFSSSATSVAFLNDTAAAPASAKDVSEAGDGSVLLWTSKEGRNFHIFVAADGGINAKNACHALFQKFYELQSIDFGGCFHTEQTTDFSYMFAYCHSLNQLDLTGLDTASAVSMEMMFASCKKLEKLDLSAFDTGNVTDMSGMFTACTALKEIDISSFDTAGVIEMDNLFAYCASLEYLDLHHFATSNVVTMGWMFNECTSLKKINVTGFDTSNVFWMRNMFYACTSLEEPDLSSFDFTLASDDAACHDDFMSKGATVNGQPWEELFK